MVNQKSWHTTNIDDTFVDKTAYLSQQLAALETRYARLERYHLMQQTIAAIIAESDLLDLFFLRIVQTICECTGWDFGELWNVDAAKNVLGCTLTWHGDMSKFPEFDQISKQMTFAPGIGLPGRVWSSHEPLWLPNVIEDKNFPRADYAAKDGIHCGIGMPIRVNNKLIGVMDFFSRMVRPPDAELIQLLEIVGQQVGLFVGRKQAEALAYEQAHQETLIEEKRRIASDLHRTAAQTLFSARVTAELLPYLWDRDLGKIWFGLGELRQLTRQSLEQTHTMLTQLGAGDMVKTPASEMLDTLIKKMTSQTKLDFQLTVKGECLLGSDAQIALYCIGQEALQNIIQHARATRATIGLFAYPESSELRISDNGRGFNPNTVLPDRVGLRIMRECAERINADLDIASTPNQGTQISLRWRC